MTDLPRDVVTELFVAGAWTDITSDVYARDPIQITRGRRDEASSPQPSSCQLTLDNRAGNYSPRNPVGAYYGSLGRNTPIRLGLRRVADGFDRTESNGWGSTAGGEPWAFTGSVGDVSADDFSVTGGEGVHQVDARGAWRGTFLEDTMLRDVDIAVTVRLDIGDVTGDEVSVELLVRALALVGTDIDTYLLARVGIEADESVYMDLWHIESSATRIADAVTVDGLTHSASQSLRVRFQAEGETLRGKVWAADSGEPYGWHVTGHTDLITTEGRVGIRSEVTAANTNTLPVVFRYDDFVVTVPRFAGEVSAWPQRQDLSGNDRFVPVEAAGITRRLGQGGAPLQSTLRRGFLSDAIEPPVVYWPCEESDGATQFAPVIGDTVLEIVSAAQPDFASNEDFAASRPLPQLDGSAWRGQIPAHTLNDRAQLRMLLSVPDDGMSGEHELCRVEFSGGDMTQLRLAVDAAGNLRQTAVGNFGSLIYDSGLFAFVLNGRPVWLSMEWEQVGADIEVNMVTLEPGDSIGGQAPGTILSAELGTAQVAAVNQTVADIDQTAVGHVSYHNVWTSLFDLADQLNAWIGETAGRRIERLCAEESIAFAHSGGLDATAAMGAQSPETLLSLLSGCAEADLGTLHEPRGALGVAYRARRSLYNQPATLALDFASSQVWAPLEPTDDDQQTRNDVTASRAGGSSARAVATSGRMSVQPPEQGGVGRYDHSETVNVETDGQLPGVAQWLLHLGTVDETRYPRITVNLASPRADSLEDDALAVDVDGRVTVANLPAVLTPDIVSQLARGYSERIGTHEHRLVLVCAPESPHHIFEVGTSRLASLESAVDAGVTDSDTSLSVAITDGLWTTDAGDLPFDVEVDGERITVTAVSGSTSPQTFTVTRSANGVVKSHDAGAVVALAEPIYLGL